MGLYGALFLDFLSVICCAVLLWRYAKLTVLHPASTCLLFHVLFVTSRAYFILAGSPTLFTAWGPGVVPLSDAEIVWAVNLADLAFLSMTAAWIKVAGNERQVYAVRLTIRRPDSSVARLSPKVIRYVGAIALPIGIAALIYFAYVPAVGVYGEGKIDLGDWNSSSSHQHFYGSLYYPLLTLPIPRQLWGDKPAVNAYQSELSNPSRPMAIAGMVPTLHGESYANFGPLVVAYWLGNFYFAAMQCSYFSVYRFTYIVVGCNLAQVFRDGLIFLVMFTVVNMMPLVASAILSYVSFRRKKARQLLRPQFVPSRARGVTRSPV